MKQVVLLSLCFFWSFFVYGQDVQKPKPRKLTKQQIVAIRTQQAVDSIKSLDKNIFFKRIPRLKIKDKVFIVNKTNHYIVQAVVTAISKNYTLTQIGTEGSLAPGETKELASFEDNDLKKFRGKVIAMKVKGVKSVIVQNNGSISSIANESDVTYDFDARFSANRHDLYIEIVNNEGIMDF